MLTLLLSAVLSTHPCHAFLDADLDRSGRVDVNDLIDVLLCFGQTACDEGDVNRDNVTDVYDLMDLLGSFGMTEDEVCQWTDIHTIAELQEINDNGQGPFGLDGNYRIVNDLDFSPEYDSPYWSPIGQHQSDPFQGTLIALPGVTLNNLRVVHPTGHPYHDLGSGLFGWIVNGYVRGLHFVEPYIRGGEFTAVLTGYAVNSGRIEDVTVTDGFVEGDRYTGGIVGRTRAVKIIDSHFSGVINAEYNGSYYTGGIAGNMYSIGVISRCSTDVLMFEGWSNMGGLVGRMGTGGIIRRSNANVLIGMANNPMRNSLGGIVGGMYNAVIENCYATGSLSVTGVITEHTPYTGGLVGYCFSGGQVHNSWSDVTIHYDGDEPSVGATVGRRGGTWGPWSNVMYYPSPWPGVGDGFSDGITEGPQ